MIADLAAKRLQLLKELLPQVSKFTILVRTGNPATAAFVREAERGAQILGVGLQVLRMGNPSELESLLASAQGGGLTMADDVVFTAHRKRIAELALQHRLPTLFGYREMVEAGGLISYGPRYSDLYRSAAGQVQKILNGTKPAEIPVEQPTRFEVVLNMRTARALGLTIPPTILVRVDEILE
jgi:putative ABC transport system substrate-binding protein